SRNEHRRTVETAVPLSAACGSRLSSSDILERGPSPALQDSFASKTAAIEYADRAESPAHSRPGRRGTIPGNAETYVGPERSAPGEAAQSRSSFAPPTGASRSRRRIRL